MSVAGEGIRQTGWGQDYFNVFAAAPPWEKMTAACRQWPEQVRRGGALSRQVMNECLRHSIEGHNNYAELGCVWLTGVAKVLEAYREARQNGDMPAEVWNRCLETSQGLVGAELAFVEGRLKSLYRLLSAATAIQGSNEG